MKILKEYINLLTEGFLKIPPLISQNMKQQIREIMAAKMYKDLYNALQAPKNFFSNDSNFEELQKKFNQELEKLEQQAIPMIKQLWKTPLANQDDIKELELPANLVYLDTEDFTFKTITKIIFKKYYSTNTDEEEISTTYFDEHGGNIHEDEYLRGRQIIGLNKTDFDFDYAKENFEFFIKESELFLVELDKIRGKRNIVPDWGMNLNTIRLTPAMFAGWTPGGKEQTEVLQFLENKKRENGEYPTIYSHVNYHELLTKDKKYAEDPHWGLYTGHTQGASSFIFSMEFVLPTVFGTHVTKSSFEYSVQELEGAVDHELGHFVQDLIGIVKKEKNAGRPPKSVKNSDSDYDKKTGKWNKDHELRDIEFYTRLEDARKSLEDFLSHAKSDEERFARFYGFVGQRIKNPNLNPDFYRFYYNSNDWLAFLKDNAPAKYQKAVKELYKFAQEKGLVK